MKAQTLNNIYNTCHIWGKCKNLKVKIKGYSDLFDIDLKNSHDKKYDCCISHFGYNFYFRTNAGLKKKKYTTFNKLKNAVITTAKKYDLIIEYFCYKPENSYRHKIIT